METAEIDDVFSGHPLENKYSLNRDKQILDFTGKPAFFKLLNFVIGNQE